MYSQTCPLSELWGACERCWCLEYLHVINIQTSFGPSNLFQLKRNVAIHTEIQLSLKTLLTTSRWISIKRISFDALIVVGCRIELAH